MILKIISGIVIFIIAIFFTIFFASSTARTIESKVGMSGTTDAVLGWKDHLDHLWAPKA